MLDGKSADLVGSGGILSASYPNFHMGGMGRGSTVGSYFLEISLGNQPDAQMDSHPWSQCCLLSEVDFVALKNRTSGIIQV